MRLFYLFIVCNFFIFTLADGQDLSSSLNKRFNQYKDSAPKERILIITDRNIYAPGDLIWFGATVFDIFTAEISERSNQLTIRLFDQRKRELFHNTFNIAGGKVDGFMQLPDGMRDGIYYLSSETSESKGIDYYYHKIMIKSKIVPQFIIEATFEEKEYIPGDVIQISLRFKNFYNEPKRNVEYQIDYFDGDIKIPGEIGKIRKEGIAKLSVKIPQGLKSGLFTYEVTASSKGDEAFLAGKYPVLSDKIFLEFYPENGSIIQGMETTVNFFSYGATGLPVSIEGDLLEEGKVIQTIQTDTGGLGSFQLTPDGQKTYAVQVKRPLLLDETYNLPDIIAKGVALQVQEKSSSMVKYKLMSSYIDPRYVIFVGISGGEIFWVSDHEIDKELMVDADLSSAAGTVAHFIALNAAAKIEGEHMLVIPWQQAPPIKVTEVAVSNLQRGKVELIIEPSSAIAGDLTFTAVNEPWLMDDLGCQPISTMILPFDIRDQLVFQTNDFLKDNFDVDHVEKFLPYYVPLVFGWERILATRGAYQKIEINDLVSDNRIICDRMMVSGSEQINQGLVTHTNMISDGYFAASNPEYVTNLYAKKVERIPAYKKMLENATPIKDVIMSIKPYSLMGNKIVFLGSTNSLLAQDGALIVIDGVNRGTDAGLLDNISPFDVDEIFVSTNASDIQRYSALNSVGLIEITLKRGEELVKEPTIKIDENTEFTTPEYANEKKDQKEDSRTTLFWNIQSIGSESGSTTITFYNSDLISRVKGKVYFIPNNGQPAAAQISYTIK